MEKTALNKVQSAFLGNLDNPITAAPTTCPPEMTLRHLLIYWPQLYISSSQPMCYNLFEGYISDILNVRYLHYDF